MSPRERIKAVINFRKPDVLPWCETFYDETIIKWFGEGLPFQNIINIEWVNEAGAVSLLNWPRVNGFDPYSYFGCYNRSGIITPVRSINARTGANVTPGSGHFFTLVKPREHFLHI